MPKVPKVSVYTRERISRKYCKAKPKFGFNSQLGYGFPPHTIFVLRYTLNGKRIWEDLPSGTGFDAARVAARKKEIELFTGEAQPKHPKPEKPTVQTGLMLADAVKQYLKNVEQKSDRTFSGYTYTLGQFQQSCANKPLASVGKQDLYDFLAFLRKAGLGDRTCHNRVGEIVTFLRHFDIKNVSIRVKYVEKKVKAYRPDEAKAMFDAATPEEWILFQFFLCLGPRDQEVIYAQWGDVDFVEKIYTVTAHPPDFTPKDYEEREIPIPDHLLAALADRQRESKSLLIFPNSDGKPDGHLLRRLQALAKRAGVKDATLHKWRKTYATLQHRAGVDARTIQKRLGHSSLETTLAYLEGEEARSDRSREQVNHTFGVFAEQPVVLIQ